MNCHFVRKLEHLTIRVVLTKAILQRAGNHNCSGSGGECQHNKMKSFNCYKGVILLRWPTVGKHVISFIIYSSLSKASLLI